MRKKIFDYWGLYEENELIGFCLYQIKDNTKVYLKHFLIDKKYRRKGYGIYLVKETLKKYSDKQIFVEVLFTNQIAKKFFEKLEFRILRENKEGGEWVMGR